MEIDFKLIAADLLSRSNYLIPEWLPGGKLIGREWTCGDLTGGQGKSLKVNLDKGVWEDFATSQKGGDLISLYAAIHGKTQFEAAKELSGETNLPAVNNTKSVQKAPEEIPTKPPKGFPQPNFKHPKLGIPSKTWTYRDASKWPLFFIARYETDEGKQILPFTYINGAWRNKHWPKPRPLYNLHLLKKNRPVCIVEGEKAADAALQLIGQHYDVVTWVGGANAWQNADWEPIYGKSVLIWPDSDDPGRECADKIGEFLKPNCTQVKIIQADRSKGWDAADALESGWDSQMVIKWAKPRVKALIETEPEEAEKPIPEIKVQDNTIPLISGSAYQIQERLGLPKTTSGAPICNLQACRMVLDGIPEFKGMFWFDEFHQKYFTKMPRPGMNGKSGEPREWTSIDNLFLLDFFQTNVGLSRLGDDVLNKGVLMFSHKFIKNEPKDWFETLKWDGVKRIDHFFIDTMGANDTNYIQAVGRNFWTSMVARVYKPGCQSDYMVVLEGDQGIGKSTAFQAIGGKWYTTASNAIERSDFYQVLNGNIIIEIAELDAFSKAEVTRIKSVITDSTDRYRAPYDKAPKDYPRQSIFVGTTNESHWQRDHTGGRRFWPVYCNEIRLDIIKENREQYFAEAVARYKAGKSWHLTPSDETKAEQERRRQVDEWEERIADYIARPTATEYTSILEIAENALKIDAGKVDIRVQRRISAALTTLGWEKALVLVDEKRKRVWRPKIYQERKDDFFIKDVS